MLTNNDLRFIVARVPRDVRELMTTHANKLFLGGGFIRAIIAGEEVNDIDLFGPDKDWLIARAKEIKASRDADGQATRLHITANAVTVLTPNRTTLQFITRWTFQQPEELMASFDFTVCQAIIWRTGNDQNSPWGSASADAFYTDLAARRLVYTHPIRNEDAGGSLMRAIKYVKRGYSIQVTALAGVVARVVGAVRDFDTMGEPMRTGVIAGLLREVDPLIAIDGFEVVDEHKTPDGFADTDVKVDDDFPF